MKNTTNDINLGRKTLFLDRDGVININHGYVYQEDQLEFIEGIFSLCQQAQKKGYQIIIVTNQSGIARKYYSNARFKNLSKWLENQFSKQGIIIRQTLHCPHHPKFNGTCTCRKPKPGMIFKAQRRFKVNLAQSIMIGDSLSDMHCAQNAKIKKSVFFTPNSLQYGPKLIPPGFKPYYQARCLKAIQQIL
jgi:D-glycero-D-manno-heptose 1,7-bisphosphate phosphatase